MHHDRVDADLLQQGDVAAEHGGQVLLAHGMAAVFDHDGGAGVAAQERQGMGQNLGLFLGGLAGGRRGDVGHAAFPRVRGRLLRRGRRPVKEEERQARAASSASAARSSGMPAPVSLLVVSTSMCAAGWRRASATISACLRASAGGFTASALVSTSW